MSTSPAQAKAATAEGATTVAEPVKAAADTKATDPAQDLLASDPMLAQMVQQGGVVDTAGKPAESKPAPAAAPVAEVEEEAAEETPGSEETVDTEGAEAEAPAEVEAEAAAEEKPEGQEEEEDDDLPAGELPKRIRTGKFSDRDRQAMLLVNSKIAKDLPAALKMLDQQNGTAPAAAAVPNEVETIQAEIEGLEKDLLAANEAFDQQKQADINLALRKADRNLGAAKERHAAFQRHQSAFDSSVSKAKTDFPEAADPASMLSAQVAGLFAMTDPQDIAKDPDIAYKLTVQAVAQLEKAGVKVKRANAPAEPAKVEAKPTVPAKPAASTAPSKPAPGAKVITKKGPAPVSGSAGTVPAPQKNPEEEVKAQAIKDLGSAYAGMFPA